MTDKKIIPIWAFRVIL